MTGGQLRRLLWCATSETSERYRSLKAFTRENRCGMKSSRILAAWIPVLAGCGQAVDDTKVGEFVVIGLDTLISTESGSLGMPFDLAITPSGSVVVADFQSQEITIVEPDRSVRTIGQRGDGPGEFSEVLGLQVDGDDLLVVDRGQGRVQRIGLDGTYVDSWSVTPRVVSSTPYLLPDGGMILGSNGRDSTLAYAFEHGADTARRIGIPVAPRPDMRDHRRTREAISRGEVPDEIRNEALVAGTTDGRVWIALQTEAVLQHYSADGTLKWAIDVQSPEMAEVRARFFMRNQAETRNTYWSLSYFADLFPAGDELWVLLTTPETSPSAVVLVVGELGDVRRRIELRGAGGATALAVDPRRERIVLSTPHDAQVLTAKVDMVDAS